jgi:hypothetical protein
MQVYEKKNFGGRIKVAAATDVSDELARLVESAFIMIESGVSTSAIPENFEGYKMPKSN